MDKFLKAFVDNFEPCEDCDGKGTDWAHNYPKDACRKCGGTTVQIKSIGVLLSELYPDAQKLLEKKGK